MTDFAPHDERGTQAQRRLVLEFVGEVRADLDSLKASAVDLEAGDSRAWRRAQVIARSISARAQDLNLGVLGNCAQELDQFSDLLFDGPPSAKPSALRSAMIALDTVRLELQSLAAKLELE